MLAIERICYIGSGGRYACATSIPSSDEQGDRPETPLEDEKQPCFPLHVQESLASVFVRKRTVGGFRSNFLQHGSIAAPPRPGQKCRQNFDCMRWLCEKSPPSKELTHVRFIRNSERNRQEGQETFTSWSEVCLDAVASSECSRLQARTGSCPTGK